MRTFYFSVVTLGNFKKKYNMNGSDEKINMNRNTLCDRHC